mgnify:CR=1 FL=1
MGLDNKKDNLRICTNSQNGMNRKLNNNNTSGHKGVHWHKFSKTWHARILMCKKRKHLGQFDTKKEAAIAYNKAAKEFFGEFARLNII